VRRQFPRKPMSTTRGPAVVAVVVVVVAVVVVVVVVT
jgi:hypothetical protein